jgi:adenylate cyclase
VAAVSFAIDVQRTLPVHQSQWPEGQRLRFRMGVGLGDVIVEGDDIHGDGVHAAAGLQAMAEPGGLLITGGIHERVRRRLDHVAFDGMAPQSFANMAEPVASYRVLLSPRVVDHNVRVPSVLNARVIAAGVVVLIILTGAALWSM